MAQERLTEFPSRNDRIDADIVSNNTSKCQNNFDDLVNNSVNVDNNNNFTGQNSFSYISGLFYNMRLSKEDINSSPSSNLDLVEVVKNFDCSTASIIATLPKLNDGNIGNLIILNAEAVGGNTITINANTTDTFNDAGNNSIELDAVDDNIILMALSTSRWLVLVNNNCTLS